jgi:hypothetical protein
MLDPEVADRLAKLLRLACSNGPDPEKLAALGRLSAIAAAHDVDWSQVFANGGGPALTEEQMHRIYSEGYHRGLADGQQQAKPARDWTPTAGTSASAGTDFGRLKAILEAAATADDNGDLSDWESAFTLDMSQRAKKYGSRTYVSGKQWEVLDRLAGKLEWNGYL